MRAYNFRMSQQRIIWGAIVFSTVIYLFVVYSLAPVPARPFQESVRTTITLAMYAAGFASFIAALVVPGLLRQPQRVKFITAMALFESCAICGLMAAFLHKDWRLYVPAWIVALIGFLREWPSEEINSPAA